MQRIIILLLTLCFPNQAAADTVVLNPNSCPQTDMSLTGSTGILKLDQAIASTGKCDWRFTGPSNTRISLKPTVLCIDCKDTLQLIDTSSGVVSWDAQTAHSAQREDPYCNSSLSQYCTGIASPPNSEVTSEAVTLRYEKKDTNRNVSLRFEYEIKTLTTPATTNTQSTPGRPVVGSGETTPSSASFPTQSWVFLALGLISLGKLF